MSRRGLGFGRSRPIARVVLLIRPTDNEADLDTVEKQCTFFILSPFLEVLLHLY